MDLMSFFDLMAINMVALDMGTMGFNFYMVFFRNFMVMLFHRIM